MHFHTVAFISTKCDIKEKGISGKFETLESIHGVEKKLNYFLIISSKALG
jgi:hypothetical protein